MSTPGYWRIDGPPPVVPPYGLLQAAETPAAGVRVVPDVDGSGIERWGNGVIVWPYPIDIGGVTDACAPGSIQHQKGFGATQPTPPQFNPMTLHVDATCTTYKVWDHSIWIERIRATFMAVRAGIIATEFLTGAQIPANPHLSDSNCTILNGGAATSVKNGLAILEDAISATRREGLIHCTPSVTTIASERFYLDNKTGVVRTINGTVVLPDMGYVVAGSHPVGGAGPGATQTWIYATGPVDIRLSEVFVMPDQPSQAVDRGSGGATTGRPNSVTYRVEQYAVVDWDTALHAAVLVDRCLDTCS